MRQAVLATLDARTTGALYMRSRYAAALREVPRALLPFWRKTAPGEFPGIPFQARFYAHALEALLTFFDCAAHSDRPCGLPSLAADSVWHAWIAMDRDNLDQFCRRHFGRSIPHAASADMAGQMGGALAACLVAARRLDGQGPAAPTLPRLFALDRMLRMPLGFGYTIELGLVAWSRLDEAGLPHGPTHYPGQLSPHGLLAAGLISETEYALGTVLAERRRDGAAGQAGGGCGTFASGSDGDAAACSDGAGGAGDGGGCGGGCGGD